MAVTVDMMTLLGKRPLFSSFGRVLQHQCLIVGRKAFPLCYKLEGPHYFLGTSQTCLGSLWFLSNMTSCNSSV